MAREDHPADPAQRPPAPTHAESARALAGRMKTGTLCTLSQEPPGYPYGSFVTYALRGGEPILLLSALAEHTRNLERDPRASLLVVEGGEGAPLARSRVTLLGPCERITDAGEQAAARAAYLAAHPDAASYFEMRDFALYRLRVEALRYIGGFGRMSWVAPADFYAAQGGA